MSMPPPRQLPRGKSSSSLNSEGKKKLVKQYPAGGIKVHNRNSSYGQSTKLNKLTRIASSESIEDATDRRPSISRSRSSDGALLKRNRSKTKLSGLQPLTRTISSQSHKSKFQKHPRAQVAFNSGGSESEEEVEEFDDQPSTIQNSETVNNNKDSHYEHSHHQQQTSQREQHEIESSMPKYFGNILSQSTGMERSIVPSDSVSHSLNNSDQQRTTREIPGATGFSSKSSLNQIQESPNESVNSRVPRSMTRDEPNESYSSFQSANLIFQPSSTNVARHFNQQQQQQQQQQTNPAFPATTLNRSGTRLNARDSSASLATDFNKNFREFLNKTPEGETRTQQKLWLMRESSILDITNANKNYRLNNAQFRTEFEKFSREYLNVRRNVNPVAGSLKRLIRMNNELISNADNKDRDISTFDKFSPRMAEKIRENHNELNNIWESCWRDHNTSSTSVNDLNKVNHQYKSQQEDTNQEQAQLHRNFKTQQQRPSNSHILSSPQAPMTRAVAKNGGASII